MTLQNMFGVVLWSDSNAQKAVIWCEDQGELAYYAPCEDTIHDGPTLDAGDLIQFDVTVQKNMRRASNPQLLEQSHSPDLPGNLRANDPMRQPNNADSKPAAAQKVVSLADYLEPLTQRRLAMLG